MIQLQRDNFLKLCQQCAVLPERICGVKKNVPLDLTVTYDNKKYYPVGYKITFDLKGNPHHTAILHDLYSNSITECDLGRVCFCE